MRVVAAVLLALHVAAGTVAIGGGPGALVTEKGGRRHRAAGRVFAAAMLGVVATAALLTVIAPDVYFAALTVGAAAPAFSGSVLLLLDPPWRQLWAVVLGQWLTVAFLVRYRRGAARGARVPA